MYSILIYIVIVFVFILFTKDIRKVIEGQTLESYDYLEFQPIVSDDSILNNQLKDHLNKYSEDMDTILKNTIDKKVLNSEIKNELNRQISSGESIDSRKENILYDIYIRDTLGELNYNEHDEESYNNYIEKFVEFNKVQKIARDITYSDDQTKLFSKKYKPSILTSNETDYVDRDYYDNIIKEKKEDELFLPGLIDKSDGIVLNNLKKDKNDIIDISNAEFCCDYSALRIDPGPPILSVEEVSKANRRIRDLNNSSVEENEEGVYAYNYPYYEYMKGQGLLYKPLYLNYDKTRNIGDINI